MNSLAPLPVVVPLGAAAVVLLLHTFVARHIIRAVAVVVVVAQIALTAALVHQSRSATIVYWFGGWRPRSGVALGISFTIDPFGGGAALLAAVVTAAALVAMSSTMRDADGIVYALVLTLMAGMAGFCLTGDLFNMFVFFELMAVSAFGLAGYHTRRLPALRSAMNFAIINSIGAFLVLMGITILYSRTGALNLAQIGRSLAHGPGPDRAAVVALALLMAGFLIKAAVVPFHFWLVDTAESAPLPLVIVLAGVLDTLGVYGLARIYWTVFAVPMAESAHAFQIVLVAIGSVSGLAAGGLSLLVRRPRRRMAFIMVAHTGIVLIGVGCLNVLGVAGSAIYAVGDGLVKVALLLGLALLGFGTEEVGQPGQGRRLGVNRRAGLVVLTVGGLATAGLPLFATGLGKASIEDAAVRAGFPWVVAVVVCTAALTGAAVFDTAFSARSEPAGRDRDGWTPLFAAAVVALLLSGLTTTVGRWAAAGAAHFVDTAAYPQGVLDNHVVPVARSSAAALSAQGLLLNLLAVAAAILLGTPFVGEALHRLVQSTRVTATRVAIDHLHDGGIGDSATWATVGTAAIAFVLAVSSR